MKQHTKNTVNAWGAFLTWLALIVAVMLALALTSCTKRVYVPVENTVLRTDTVTHYINSTDSVTVIERVYESDTRYDSIAPILDSLNRVIGWDRYHFRESTKKDSREMQRLQSLVDSLRAVKQDSIDRPVLYPVERKLTRWEQTKMDFGGLFLGGLIAVTVGAVIVWIVKRKRRV